MREEVAVKTTRRDIEGAERLGCPPQLLLGCDAFILDGVLTEEECQDLIRQAEGLWTFWEPRPRERSALGPRRMIPNSEGDPSATLTPWRPLKTRAVRLKSCEVSHPDLAARIWRRVSELVRPEVWPRCLGDAFPGAVE